MHDAPLADRAPGRGDIDRRRERRRYCLVRLADIGGDLQQTVIVDQQYIKLVAAEQVLAAVEDLVEHRLGIGHRGADHAENLGGGFLLLQRLARLGDEPRVLHRDDRLRREVLQQRDLLIGERPNFSAINSKSAERDAVFD